MSAINVGKCFRLLFRLPGLSARLAAVRFSAKDNHKYSPALSRWGGAFRAFVLADLNIASKTPGLCKIADMLRNSEK